MIQTPDYPLWLEDTLAKYTMAAVDPWVSQAHMAVFPAIIADASPKNPRLEGILNTATQWLELFTELSLPAFIAAVIHRLWDTTTTAGVNPSDLYDTPTPVNAAIITRAHDTARTIGLSDQAFTHAERITTWVQHIHTVAETLPHKINLPEIVFHELATAIKNGHTPDQRATLVAELLGLDTAQAVEQWNTRTRRIARTESTTLINQADHHAITLSAPHLTNQPIHKIWVATIDPRTRDTHFELDGKRLPLDGTFQVGQATAEYPGDPNLPAGERINCRCTLTYLPADEATPTEIDRQTERQRADGTRPDPTKEITDRATRDVTRARDTDHHNPVTAGADMTNQTFETILAPKGEYTGDSRIIHQDAAITHRNLPLPLMWQKTTADGHNSAVVIGKLTHIDTNANPITGKGELFATPEAAQATELITQGVIYPSIDLADITAKWILEDENGNPLNEDNPDVWDKAAKEVMKITAATIIATTLVPTPAFAGTSLTITGTTEPTKENNALTAAAPQLTTYRPESFTNPNLTEPTPIHVNDNGHVTGHLATWDTPHIGMPGRTITPPRTTTNYAHFHTSALPLTTGDWLPVGRLTANTGHATTRANATQAAAHYDNTGTTWAFVRAGEDEHGIWVAGVLNPDAPPETIRAGASAPLSGDWRTIGGHLELVAALSVNTPGFPITHETTPGELFALCAAGVLAPAPNRALVAAVRLALREHEATGARERKAHRLRARVLRSQTLGGE